MPGSDVGVQTVQKTSLETFCKDSLALSARAFAFAAADFAGDRKDIRIVSFPFEGDVLADAGPAPLDLVGHGRGDLPPVSTCPWRAGVADA